jgi:hypothetical protein
LKKSLPSYQLDDHLPLSHLLPSGHFYLGHKKCLKMKILKGCLKAPEHNLRGSITWYLFFTSSALTFAADHFSAGWFYTEEGRVRAPRTSGNHTVYAKVVAVTVPIPAKHLGL